MPDKPSLLDVLNNSLEEKPSLDADASVPGMYGDLGLDPPEPIPDAIPENMVCLRGPCKYYQEIVQNFDAGNTKGTLQRAPLQIMRFCIRGTEALDLYDGVPRKCSTGDPSTPDGHAELEERRNAYLKAHPEIQEAHERFLEESQKPMMPEEAPNGR